MDIKRTKQIKEVLDWCVPQLETLELYNKQAIAYRELGAKYNLTDYQELEYKDILEKYLVLSHKIGQIKIGIDVLKKISEDDEQNRDYDILINKHLYAYSNDKNGYLTGYQESGIRKRIDYIYSKLDRYIQTP